MEEQTDWDIVVIGGGVVGCAVFRQFCLMGARTLLLEKGAISCPAPAKPTARCCIPASSAQRRHELRCMQAGYREFIAIRERMNLPLLPTGALVVALDEQQWPRCPRHAAGARQRRA